jgi:hypothetical protein
MRKTLLILLLIVLAAAAAHADIRRLMQAKGYSPANGGQCEGACGGFVSSQDSISEPVPIDDGCTFPATMPCTFGG